ncbi:MAG: SET domain-containing protein [Patescibacteria group bacterium]|nr:SET domain-containing protein [Patescibacteria group bacterium]
MVTGGQERSADMNKTKLLKQLRDDVFTRLAPSPIHGIGVFAIRPIPEGTSPFRGDSTFARSIRVSDEDLRGVPEAVKKLVHDMCAFQKGYYWIPDNGLEEATKSWHMNHSSSPNMRVIREDFIAIEDIEVGEELTVDYTTYSEEIDLP